jgi:hypothetical protein
MLKNFGFDYFVLQLKKPQSLQRDHYFEIKDYFITELVVEIEVMVTVAVEIEVVFPC